MRNQKIDTLTIQTATVLSRRASLLALGGVAIAASADRTPALAGAASKKAKKRCRRQIGQCESAIASACADPEIRVSQQECLALIRPCFQHFGSCQAAAAFDCLKAASDVIAPPPP
jgi:hypothetical protein